jgi:hypothetical protein
MIRFPTLQMLHIHPRTQHHLDLELFKLLHRSVVHVRLESVQQVRAGMDQGDLLAAGTVDGRDVGREFYQE